MELDRKCKLCGSKIPFEAHGNTEYCSKRCRHRDRASRVQERQKSVLGNPQTAPQAIQAPETANNTAHTIGTAEIHHSQVSNTNNMQQDNQRNQQAMIQMPFQIPDYVLNYQDKIQELMLQVSELTRDNATLKEKVAHLEASKAELQNEILELEAELDDSDETDNSTIMGLPKDTILPLVAPALGKLVDFLTRETPQTNPQSTK